MNDFNWGDEEQWRGGQDRQPRMSDLVDMLEYDGTEWSQVRLIGNPVSTMIHWLNIKTKKGKRVALRKVCLGFDPKTGKHDGDKCPYCSACENGARLERYTNVIERSLQENEPRKKRRPSGTELKTVMWNGHKHRVVAGKKKGWTPVRVLKVTTLVGRKIAEITSLNRRTVNGERKVYGPTHPKFGFDMLIKFDKDAHSASEMYSVQKGDVCPLSIEERKLLVWAIPEQPPESHTDAEKDAKRLRSQLIDRDGNLLFPGEHAAATTKGKRNEFSDEFDADEDFEDEKKTGRKRKKATPPDDGGDGDDWDDEKPVVKKRRRRSKPKTRTAKRQRKQEVESDDAAEDDWDEKIPF